MQGYNICVFFFQIRFSINTSIVQMNILTAKRTPQFNGAFDLKHNLNKVEKNVRKYGAVMTRNRAQIQVLSTAAEWGKHVVVLLVLVSQMEQLDTRRPPRVFITESCVSIGGVICQIKICKVILAIKQLPNTIINRKMAKMIFKIFSSNGNADDFSLILNFCFSPSSSSFLKKSKLELI